MNDQGIGIKEEKLKPKFYFWSKQHNMGRLKNVIPSS